MSREQDDRQTAIHLAHVTRTKPAPLGDWAMPVSRRPAVVSQGPYYAACKGGPCKQGRKLCPSPMACLLAEREGGKWARFVARVLKLFRRRT